MQQNIIVVDDFYKDPDLVRELALESELLDKGRVSQNFPGRESLYNFYSDELVSRFEKIVGSKIIVDEHINAFGRFRFSYETDERRTQIHFDNKDWSAVIYLTPTYNTSSGTIFTQHKQTGLYGPPMNDTELASVDCKDIYEFDRKYVLPDTNNIRKWSIHMRVPFKYNRLVLFRGKSLFHGSEALFGRDLNSARLTQNFFFDEVL